MTAKNIAIRGGIQGVETRNQTSMNNTHCGRFLSVSDNFNTHLKIIRYIINAPLKHETAHPLTSSLHP